MRIIGMDLSRAFAELVAWEDGRLTRMGRVDMRRDLLSAFAATLRPDDVVIIEATGNAAATYAVLAPHVAKVVVANPKQVRMIAHAKIKTDAIDAGVLAQLYACGYLPEVWMPDPDTAALRRQVTRRSQLVRQRTRLKNMIQAILHAHLIPSCPHADILSLRGRAWIAEQMLPGDERAALERHMRECDRLAEDLKEIDRELAGEALASPAVRRLITIPGIDTITAQGVMAAIGDPTRFASPDKLVSYFGLNPTVRQSGPGPAQHGRISKQGRGHARGLLVEAAWSATRAAGPLRAFFLRVAAKRGQHVAAVAVARKMLVIIWHLLKREEDYAWARPALHARKIRQAELKAGLPARRGQRGAAAAYFDKAVRDEERRAAEGAERAYARLVHGWTRQRSQRRPATASPS
jgi:transposase